PLVSASSAPASRLLASLCLPAWPALHKGVGPVRTRMILSGKHMSSKAIWWLHVHLWVEAKQRKSFFIPTPSGSLSHFLLSSSLSCGVNENHMGLGGHLVFALFMAPC